MATATVDLTALDRARRRLLAVGAPSSLVPLMISLMQIIVEDNRRGVLAGTDRHGGPMLDVTYRPLGRTLSRRGRGRAIVPSQRNDANARVRRGHFAGFGMMAAGLHNNLTRAEYERLAGPPLAPRGPFSRVITNLKTGWQRDAAGVWRAFGYWDQVVSPRGRKFLHAHFTGASTGRGHRVHLPTRDLRGVRPEGMAKARAAANAWARDLLRSTT